MAMSAKAENRVIRWREQRWLLDMAVAEQGDPSSTRHASTTPPDPPASKPWASSV